MSKYSITDTRIKEIHDSIQELYNSNQGVVNGSWRYLYEDVKETYSDSNGFRNKKHKNEGDWRHYCTNAEIKQAYKTARESGHLFGSDYLALFVAFVVIGAIFVFFDGWDFMLGLSNGEILAIIGGLIVFLIVLMTVGDGSGVKRDWEW